MEHEELHQHVDNPHSERNTEGLIPKRNAKGSVPERNTEGLASKRNAKGNVPERNTEGLTPKRNTRENIPERNTDGAIPKRNTRESVPERDATNVSGTHSSMIIRAKLEERFGLGYTSLVRETTKEGIYDALNDGNWQVRTAAVRRLGEIGDQTEVALLLSRLEKDEVPEVRAAAARALSSIREIIPETPLIAALEDDDDNVREAAALALASLGIRLSQQAIDALEEAFYGEPDEDTRATIVTTLGRAAKRTPLKVLEVALCDTDWQVREAAALAMGHQKDRANIAALMVMLDDEVKLVRDAAVHALNQVSAETRPTNKPHSTKQDKPPTHS